MHLPSFLWLWRVAAWSMGLTWLLYLLLAVMGWILTRQRLRPQWRLGLSRPHWRQLHLSLGILLVACVLLLLGIGIVGTYGHYGSLGHSWHLPAGLAVVALVCLSALLGLSIQGSPTGRGTIRREWHVVVNGVLLLALLGVTVSGWQVVQKYLPPP
ncbi:MAG: DUF4079 family protein [Cyanobacteriota bacterium]|nr:DUF4079 family protein [Cyanobacteriota bacterium]